MSTVKAKYSGFGTTNLRSEKTSYYLMVLPSFIVLLILTLIPLLLTIYLSFTNATITTLNKFEGVGLSNYISIFTKDRYFWDSCLVMLKLAGGNILLQMFFGVLIALLWFIEFKGVRVFRVMHMIPMMITGIVCGFIWRMLLNTDYGIVNYLLEIAGLEKINWLGDETYAMVSLYIVGLWRDTPFVSIIILAALQGVDESYTEAALIDGGNSRQIFFKVTLPLIRPSLIMVVMFQLIGAIRAYDTISALTAGGPGRATTHLNMYTYSVGFMQWRLGYSAALSMLMLIIILGSSLIFTHFINKDNTEQ
ncbi:MAG: carbohydrate ABC transporter permease [Christensenellales bacterium]|jgi:multiple sugar transport system permease protein